MGEVLHGLLHPPTKKMWTKVVNEKIPRHPELVSGSIGGSESKSKRFRNKFGMTRTEKVQKMKKFCVVATIKKLEQQPTKKEKKKIINNQKGEKNEAEKHN